MKFLKISETQFNKDFKESVDVTYEELLLPERATKYSAGYDFFAPYTLRVHPDETIKIPTGIRVELDPDKVLICVPRSGLGFKYGIELTNTLGIIDADYFNSDNEGHIWVKLHYPSYMKNEDLIINKGEAMFQGIIMSYFKVEDDTTDTVRNGGFGSTTINK